MNHFSVMLAEKHECTYLLRSNWMPFAQSCTTLPNKRKYRINKKRLPTANRVNN